MKRIIIKPLITEKMTADTEAMNRYGFVVEPQANKIEIKSAVEGLYDVRVEKIQTMRYAGKNKTQYTKTGVVEGAGNAYKKAIVSLAEGDTIDFYSNI